MEPCELWETKLDLETLQHTWKVGGPAWKVSIPATVAGAVIVLGNVLMPNYRNVRDTLIGAGLFIGGALCSIGLALTVPFVDKYYMKHNAIQIGSLKWEDKIINLGECYAEFILQQKIPTRPVAMGFGTDSDYSSLMYGLIHGAGRHVGNYYARKESNPQYTDVSHKPISKAFKKVEQYILDGNRMQGHEDEGVSLMKLFASPSQRDIGALLLFQQEKERGMGIYKKIIHGNFSLS